MKTLRIFSVVAVGLMLSACPPVSSAVHQAVVRWAAGASYAPGTTYRVYRSTNGTTFAVVAVNIPLSSLIWKDASVTPNKTYWYYVTAFKGLESARSPVVKYTVTP